ncbi:MAG: cupin domain-containing protein [Rickettsiales bacterium]
MAEKPDNVGSVEVKESNAGPGHNQPKEVVWERWQKKRTFVRALEGTYGELQQGLMDQPRIYKSTDWQWKGGPQFFDKPIVNPQRTDIAQSIETHLSCIAPGGTGQRHGHMNSALFYVIQGKGYDIHDGKRYDYEAGDIIIVENGCVHQHFNASDEEDLICLVMKAKPLFLFMHMLFQKVAAYPPKEAPPGWEHWEPPTDL